MKWTWVATIVLSGFEGVHGFLTALTPAVAVECEQTNLTWFGGTPPYAISLLANDTNGYRALGFANINGTSFVTKVPFAAGQLLELLVRDSTGAEAFSSSFKTQSQNGSSSTCALNATPKAQSKSNGNQTLKITFPSSSDTFFACDSSFTVNWEGGQAPYNLLMQTTNRSIVMEQAFGGSILNGRSVGSKLQLPPGSQFKVTIVDSAGTITSIGPIELANGPSQDCLITSDATNNATSFVQSSTTDASEIGLPTPALHSLKSGPSSTSSSVQSTSKSTSTSIAANVDSKGKGSSGKTATIVGSVLGVASVGLAATAFVIWRHYKMRRSPTKLLSSGKFNRDYEHGSSIPVSEVERFKPVPFYLPAMPEKTAAPVNPYADARNQMGPTTGSVSRPPMRVITNPDSFDSRSYKATPTPGYPKEVYEYYYEDDHHDPLTPYTVVGPTTWENEKAMLR